MPASSAQSDSEASPVAQAERAPARGELPIRLLGETSLTGLQWTRMFDRLNAMPWMLDDTTPDPISWAAAMLSPTTRCFVLGELDDPAAVMWACNITPGLHAYCAYAAFDKRGLGREREVRKAMRAIHEGSKRLAGTGLHRFNAVVASPNTSAQRFMARLGFTKEGLVREGLCYHGRWTDIVLFGMLVSELEAAEA